MSELWTPSGDDPVPEDTASGDGEPTPEELEDELRQARAELAAVPVVDLIANHAIGLWQLAVLHLTPDPARDGSPSPPRLDQAALAIDALAALVDDLGTRLAPHDETLRDAVRQLRLAFVEVSGRAGGDD